MEDNILRKITYKSFTEFLVRFIEGKFKILIYYDNETRSKIFLRFSAKNRKELFLVEHDLTIRGLDEINVPSANWWDTVRSVSAWNGFSEEHTHIYLCLFLLLMLENDRKLKNLDSIFDFPSIKEYDKMKKMANKGLVLSFILLPVYKSIAYCEVERKFILGAVKPMFVEKKIKKDDRIKVLLNKYKRRDPSLGKVMLNFTDIVLELIEQEAKVGKSHSETQKKHDDVNDLYTVEQAAKYVNRSKSTLYRMTSNRTIHYKKVKGRILIKREELDKFFHNRDIASYGEIRSEALAEEMLKNI